jgi:hypothetical protein
MRKARVEDSGSNDSNRFLKAGRVTQIGELIAPMIGEDMSWIERRKESVQLLDDTALRRQISVDFSLRTAVKPLLKKREEESEHLYCAPVFVLPKSPSDLMSFDLCDESGNSLSLISREDNARISGEALVCLARISCADDGTALPSDLEDELRRVATSSSIRAGQIAKRLSSDALEPWPAELAALQADSRFCWWLATLAHSSIVAILFRATGPRRKLVKLTFEAPIRTKQRALTRLGWASYRVAIDSSLIEARSSHFEAEAPPGLRISKAQLIDSEHEQPVAESGFMKRVHLYRPNAERAGAGTAILWLDVSGPGFVGGAMMASVLTLGALIACTIEAKAIAANPTSAPALLLVLPGLIASYVARPDQHALTTRLLSSARRLLLGIALCAYVAAARVALAGGTPAGKKALADRTDSLQRWLGILAIAAGLLCAGLAVTWVRSKLRVVRPQSADRFRCSEGVRMQPAVLERHLGDPNSGCPTPSHYTFADPPVDGVITMSRSAWHGEWVLTLEVEEIGGESLVSATLDYVSLLPASLALPFLRGREATRVADGLEEMNKWAGEERGAEAASND